MADIIWQALGQPKHYIEPFFGSGVVLLQRPDYDPTTHTETICDKDGFIANVWRAMKFAPEETAKVCDWPVNHCDLSARKKAMIKRMPELLPKLIEDEKFCDVEIAGYWIWGASCWIGSGLTSIGQRPHIGNAGKGVHKIGKIPHLTGTGMGVHKIGQIPHISDAGKGVPKVRSLRKGRATGDGEDIPIVAVDQATAGFVALHTIANFPPQFIVGIALILIPALSEIFHRLLLVSEALRSSGRLGANALAQPPRARSRQLRPDVYNHHLRDPIRVLRRVRYAASTAQTYTQEGKGL